MLAINQNICTKCGGCAAVCPCLAIEIRDSSSRIDSRCNNCGTCLAFCPLSAIEVPDASLQRKKS